MAATSKPTHDSLIKSVALAHLILALHVLLLAVMVLLVFFFSGIIRYMFWIFLIGAIGIGFSAYLIYRRLKREGKTISELLRPPRLQGRSVEIGLLGGLVTLKLGQSSALKTIAEDIENQPRQLEDTELIRIRELAALGRLLEKELITAEEFNSARQRLLGHQH